MADWKDGFRQGSFRGVSFFIESHEFAGGRRAVEHEFPSKDVGNTEDIGRRLRGFSLEVYVLGDDYFQSRDDLIDALEAEGAGELIHPYLGTKSVQVFDFSVSETASEGRIARFQIKFVEAGEPKFPAESTDAFEQANSIADQILATTGGFFSSVFDVSGPARVLESAQDVVNQTSDVVLGIAKQAGDAAQGIADVAFQVRQIKGDINNLLRQPGLLVERFQNAFGLLFGAVSDSKTLASALSNGTSNIVYPEIQGADTPTVQKIKGNQQALKNFIIETSVANQAKAAVNGNYVSVNEAVIFREQVNQDVERQLDFVVDDNAFQELRDLSVAVSQALPPQTVGEVLTFTPNATLPALVISNRLFGNIDKEQEIINQNSIRHPGFVPAQSEIEVSSDG